MIGAMAFTGSCMDMSMWIVKHILCNGYLHVTFLSHGSGPTNVETPHVRESCI